MHVRSQGLEGACLVEVKLFRRSTIKVVGSCGPQVRTFVRMDMLQRKYRRTSERWMHPSSRSDYQRNRCMYTYVYVKCIVLDDIDASD